MNLKHLKGSGKKRSDPGAVEADFETTVDKIKRQG